MGNARWKWIQRASIYEELLRTEGSAAAKKYMEQFDGKLEKFMKGVADLRNERLAARDEEMAGRHDAD